jgi:histidinol-phosphate phosphatase family protein
MRKRAILLDRDETLNHDPGYLNDPGLVKLLPGVLEGLTRLKREGFDFFVLTNQSGVARGLISKEQLAGVNGRLAELLAEGGITIERFYICTHSDEDKCDCRKPLPGLVNAFLADYPYSPEDCFIIGDRLRDIEAAESRGIRGILLSTEAPQQGPANLIFCARDLVDAAAHILELED